MRRPKPTSGQNRIEELTYTATENASKETERAARVTHSVSMSSGYKEQIPYPTGSPMYLIDSEDPDEIKEIVEQVVKDLRK